MNLLRGFNPDRIREHRDSAMRLARIYKTMRPTIRCDIAAGDARAYNRLLVQVLKAKRIEG